MNERKIYILLALILIIALGAVFRFTGLNWDQNKHLHPDERYISMVLSALTPPKNLTEYLDPNRSSLSPYIHNFGSYIYGQLPLTMMTYLTYWTNMVGYDKAFLLGRGLSALLDTLAILLTFKLGKRLWNEKVGIIGAAFYAFSPLPIQAAHFMTMESWMTFSWLVVMLILTRSPRRLSASLVKFRKLHNTVIIGVLLGASLAIKISSVMLVPVVVGVMAAVNWDKLVRLDKLVELGMRIAATLVIAILSFRFLQPTIFQSASWLDWSLRADFYQAFNFQKLAIDGKVMFPPQWQWEDTQRWWFPLKNLVLWGLGPVTGGLAVTGVIWQIWRIRQIRRISRIQLVRLILAAWIAAIFLWQGGKFVKTMRYYLPLFPLLALFAASAISSVNSARSDLARSDLAKLIGKILLVGSVMISGIWALMFTNIYRTPTTRVTASEWIYKNIPSGSKIMLEEWDDPLPLSLLSYPGRAYKTEMVPVYAPDDEKKQFLIDGWINNFDWIVLSSRRAKNSIGRLPDKFPLMAKFYADLDNGSLGFVKAADFVSFPSLEIGNWSLVIQDSSAEESWWVYDHPTVTIYQKYETY